MYIFAFETIFKRNDFIITYIYILIYSNGKRTIIIKLCNFFGIQKSEKHKKQFVLFILSLINSALIKNKVSVYRIFLKMYYSPHNSS